MISILKRCNRGTNRRSLRVVQLCSEIKPNLKGLLKPSTGLCLCRSLMGEAEPSLRFSPSHSGCSLKLVAVSQSLTVFALSYFFPFSYIK